jgi:hypothetical protein
MDEEEKKIWIERSKVLRADLKVWEKEFQSQNEGRKASREDIKKNPEIGMHTMLSQATDTPTNGLQLLNTRSMIKYGIYYPERLRRHNQQLPSPHRARENTTNCTRRLRINDYKWTRHRRRVPCNPGTSTLTTLLR